MSGSPPPDLAAMMMARLSLLKTLPRLASAAPFERLMVAQWEWPDMVCSVVRIVFVNGPWSVVRGQLLLAYALTTDNRPLTTDYYGFFPAAVALRILSFSAIAWRRSGSGRLAVS